MSELPEETIEKAIYPAGFYRNKARQIKEIARLIEAEHDGRVPNTLESLLAFSGVGRKTANLVLGLGFNIPSICVDTHVHRISNRLGLVTSKNPEATEFQLMELLQKRHWTDINDLLVTFGQNQCHPISPRCSTCPLDELCPRIGVERFR
jgi:endonuclease-3